MGMQSNFAVKALFIFMFIIAFYLPNAFAGGEICGADVCGKDETCAGSMCVKKIQDSECPIDSWGRSACPVSISTGTPASNSGSSTVSSGSKGTKPRSKRPPKNNSNDPSTPADDKVSPSEDATFSSPSCNGHKACPQGYYCGSWGKCVMGEAPGSTESQQNSDASGVSACEHQYESLLQECQAKIDETSRTCDDKNDSGMSNVINGAAQITLSMGQSTASSVQKSCSDMAALTQGANAALAAFRLNCGDSIKTCKSTCSLVKDFAVANNSCLNIPIDPNAQTVLTQKGDEVLSECNGFSAKVGEANTAIQNFTQTLGNATKCETATAANVALSKLPQFCQSQPNYPGCNPMAPVDCTNPAMAANKVCICSKNPMDTSCFVQQKAGGDHMPGGIGDPSSRLNKKADAGFGGDIPDLPPIDQGNPNTTAGNPISGHQGGNGGLGGGDSGGGGPPGTGGSGGSGSDSQASGSGFYGSNGSGGYGAGGGYNGGSGNGGRYTAGAGTAGAKTGAPDLRKFLPGGQYDPRRGLSGMTGPDGITGPHSDIWRKVQNRYQATSPTLLP